MPPKEGTSRKKKKAAIPPARPAPVPWDEFHPARILLYNAIKNGEIPEDMKPKDVFMKYCHTAAFNTWGMEYNANFGNRLHGLRDIVGLLKERKVEDASHFKAYREIHPRPATDRKGVPFWDGSQAQVMLNIDMDAGKHLTKKPWELWKSRELYKQWDKEVFRGHIHQEKDTRKYLHTLHVKAEELLEAKKNKRVALADKVDKYSKFHFDDSDDSDNADTGE